MLITEQRLIETEGQGPRKGHVVIRGAPDKLMDQLMVENSTTDPTYIEDFLLTYRTFLNAPVVIADQLLDWFKVSHMICRRYLRFVNQK